MEPRVETYPPERSPVMEAEDEFFKRLEQDPEMQERARSIVKSFENAPDLDDDDVLGIHGTSMFALMVAIENGSMMGSQNLDYTRTTERGEIFFNELPEPEDQDDAEGYAFIRAATDYFLITSGIGMNCSDSRILDYLPVGGDDEDNKEEFLEACAEYGLSKEKAMMIFEEAQLERGLVVSLDKEIQGGFVAQGEEIDKRLNMGTNGIPHSMMIGVEPQGQREYDFLVRLQNTIAGLR